MEVERRVLERADSLTRAERRIAEAVLATPQLVGFGTVADLATAAGVGTATVVRFATKLGFDGYTDLQQSVQRDLTGQLRPAVERIRDQRTAAGSTALERHLEIETANVRTTLEAADAATVESVVARLADDAHAVLVLSGVASRGVAAQFVGDLGQLRPGCSLLDGTPVDVARTLALAGDEPTVVALDLRRYERWVVDAVRRAHDTGAWVVAITDSVLSPLAAGAARTFVLAAASDGPFDSHVGTLALANHLVAGVAAVRRAVATSRLDRLEAAWRDHEALTDR
jgi:DNA-binding MurR/RpiR family transcriptional regulator